MAGRHKQAVAQRATKTHIRAALGQVNMANRQALRIEDPHPIELFRPRIGSASAQRVWVNVIDPSRRAIKTDKSEIPGRAAKCIIKLLIVRTSN